MVHTVSSLPMQPQSEISNWSNVLLLTKLRAPRIASDDVVRPRLLEELERGADKKLTLVITPAGYGKSTLLSRWQGTTTRASGWLSLDAGDNDFLVFMRYLVASVASIDPCICQQTTAMIEAPSPPAMTQLVRSLLNEVAESTRPFVLILDDYHVISSPEVKSAVSQIMYGMPVNMSMVISARQEPELPTLKMIARGELTELGQADLSFTDAETTEFLMQRQTLELSTSDVGEIAAWCEGWPVALRLISQVLRGRSREQVVSLLAALSHNVPSIGDYLWDEVLLSRPPEERTFMVQTSILEQFNPELAAEVTGIPESASILQGLARDGLFVTRIDGPGNWYRYHHLFADVLRQRLQDELDEAARFALHARAAQWYEEHGLIPEAAAHAISSRQWQQAARCLVSVCQDFYDQERIGSLRSWLEGLPDEPLIQEPRLAYWLAWALMRSGHARRAARLLEISSRALPQSGDNSARVSELQARVLSSIYSWDSRAGEIDAKALLEEIPPEAMAERVRTSVMLALLQQTEGRLSEAATTLETARLLNGRVGIRGLQVLELNITAGLMLDTGKLKEPAELYRRVIATGDPWNDVPVQNAHRQLASILVEWNRPDEAREQIQVVLNIATRMDTPLQIPGAHGVLARLAMASGQWDVGLDEIERAIAIAADNGTTGPLRMFEELKCRIWLATDQLTLAPAWLRQVGTDILDSVRFEDMPTTLTAMRVRMAEGRSEEIAGPLQRLRDVAVAGGWNRDLHTIEVLRALAASACGNDAEALQAIEHALQLGASEGFLRSYLDEGAGILPLLRLATREGSPQRGAAIAVLAAAGEPVPTSAPLVDQAPSILSNRERDVMRLVASGLSNRAIGDTLFISEETVKTHLRRVFEKLDASSRTQAIHIAQQLDLL